MAREPRRQGRLADREAQQRNVRPRHRDDRSGRGLRTDKRSRPAGAPEAGGRVHRQGPEPDARRLALPARIGQLRHVGRRLAGDGASQRPPGRHQGAREGLHACRQMDEQRRLGQTRRALWLHRPRQGCRDDGRGHVRAAVARRPAQSRAPEGIGRIYRLARAQGRHEEPEPVFRVLRLPGNVSAAGAGLGEMEPRRQAAAPEAAGSEGRRRGHVAGRQVRRLGWPRHLDRAGRALAPGLLPLPADVRRQGCRRGGRQEDDQTGSRESG